MKNNPTTLQKKQYRWLCLKSLYIYYIFVESNYVINYIILMLLLLLFRVFFYSILFAFQIYSIFTYHILHLNNISVLFMRVLGFVRTAFWVWWLMCVRFFFVAMCCVRCIIFMRMLFRCVCVCACGCVLLGQSTRARARLPFVVVNCHHTPAPSTRRPNERTILANMQIGNCSWVC